jgi:glycerate dehydrogenase
MRIVVTDGYTLNPGDLNWEPLRELGNLILYDRTEPVQTVARVFDASVIVTNKTRIGAEELEAAGGLKLVAVTATGYNNVDTAAAGQMGIPVCNVPGYGTFSVAQHVFALLLECTNHVGLHSADVRQGGWNRSPDWCYTLSPMMELQHKTMGIVGMGQIGRQVARLALAFGMKVVYQGGTADNPACEPVSMHALFMQSDVVSLHCPLTDANRGFVNRELLGLMKPSAILINTARGGLICETDLAFALGQGGIARAALDVVDREPPPADHPLTRLNKCMITPHIAWMSREARQRILDITVSNIRGWIGGEPRNVVNII